MSVEPKSVCPLCNGVGDFSFASTDLMFSGQVVYTYHQCQGCGAVYHYPIPGPEVIANFYPDAYMIYDKNVLIKKPGKLQQAVLRGKYGYKHIPAIFGLRIIAVVAGWVAYRGSIPYVPVGKALDVGCGNGRFLHKLKALGWNCEGVEFNATAVTICRSHGLTVHHGDLGSAKFANACFDLITARHVIEHLPDPVYFMQEAARILKPGGRLLVMTPNSRALGRSWFGKYWFDNDVPRHLILFSPSNLDRLATRHGFRRITLKLNTSPKIILNSIDYKTHNTGRPSKQQKMRRLLAKVYVLLAILLRRGDEIAATYQKP